MKVTGYGSIRPASTGGAAKSDKAGSAGAFADLLALSSAESTEQSSPVSDLAAASALSNLLALQEISEEDVQRRKLVQKGKSLLEVLERLRQQLLMGTMSPQVMVELNRQLSVQKQFVSDPHLNELIEDIELRAAVELAKLEVAVANRTNK